ncbi:MAG TPA: class I SAM-dependent methyltransferase [Chlamydiales bacterium]|nr:class I SAM-dependent methyltransferase [Chlamydiales bacterium]
MSVTFALYGDWDPEYCLPNCDLSILEDPIFQALKTDMKEVAKYKWGSVHKVDLLMDLIYLTKPEFCVEIGVFKGASAIPIATALRYNMMGNLLAIDAWSNAVAIQNMAYDDPYRRGWSTVDLEGSYQTFIQELRSRSLLTLCDVLCTSSENAILFVEDSIDFLHLDGDQSEKGSLQDVELYLPKVRSGGFILISNLFVTVGGKGLKMKAFAKIFEQCEMLCEMENDDAVLLRKN